MTSREMKMNLLIRRAVGPVKSHGTLCVTSGIKTDVRRKVGLPLMYERRYKRHLVKK